MHGQGRRFRTLRGMDPTRTPDMHGPSAGMHALPAASCEPRERAVALGAIAVALLACVTIASVAMVLEDEPAPAEVVRAEPPRPALPPPPPPPPKGHDRRADAPVATPAPDATLAGGAAAPAQTAGAPPTSGPPVKLGFSVAAKKPEPPPPPEPVPAGTGSGEGSGGGSGTGTGGGGEFMGLRAKGTRIAYVIDHSTSMTMTTRMRAAHAELLRSINGLGRDQQYLVLMYHKDIFASAKGGKMTPADARGKQAAAKWLSQFDGSNVVDWSDPDEAVGLALDAEPDTIFILSDGLFNREDVVATIRLRNPDGRIQVNTIAFDSLAGEQVLKRIAAENGGEYRFVPAAAPLQAQDP